MINHAIVKIIENDPKEIDRMIALGYARTSRKFGIVSRVDRPDWGKAIPGGKGKGADDEDHYRRCYSGDKFELGPKLGMKFPASRKVALGFVPKPPVDTKPEAPRPEGWATW
jgi:hypothetical protein